MRVKHILQFMILLLMKMNQLRMFISEWILGQLLWIMPNDKIANDLFFTIQGYFQKQINKK